MPLLQRGNQKQRENQKLGKVYGWSLLHKRQEQHASSSPMLDREHLAHENR